jgi:hypothetical protein
METELGNLSPKALDLRALVDFCCIWRYDYPDTVLQICEAIGGTGPIFGRCHYQVDSARRSVLAAYARAMEAWLGKLPLEVAVEATEENGADVARTVYRLLGQKNDIKTLLVERSLLGLAARSIDCSYWGESAPGDAVSLIPDHAAELAPDWRKRMRHLHEEIYETLGSDGVDFLCEVGGTEPACHFKFLRRLDILLGSIGCLRWRGALPPKDSRVSGRRQITKNYLEILRAYWDDSPPRQAVFNDTHWDTVKERVYKALEDRDPLKRWLVASLWKNIKGQTERQAYTMRRWVEFVQIGGQYVQQLAPTRQGE